MAQEEPSDRNRLISICRLILMPFQRLAMFGELRRITLCNRELWRQIDSNSPQTLPNWTILTNKNSCRKGALFVRLETVIMKLGTGAIHKHGLWFKRVVKCGYEKR